MEQKLNEKNAAAFRAAAKSVDKLGVPEAWKPIFKGAMEKFAVYFDAHPDITMDVEKLFKDKLYDKTNGLKFEKLSRWASLQGALAQYNIDANTIFLMETKEGNTGDDEHTLIHEFIHFLYCQSYSDVKLAYFFEEALTESLARQVSGYAYTQSYEAEIEVLKALNRFKPIGKTAETIDCVPYLNGKLANYIKNTGLKTEDISPQIMIHEIEQYIRNHSRKNLKDIVHEFSNPIYSNAVLTALFNSRDKYNISDNIRHQIPIKIPEEYMKVGNDYLAYLQAMNELTETYPKNYKQFTLQKAYFIPANNDKCETRIFYFNAGEENFVFKQTINLADYYVYVFRNTKEKNLDTSELEKIVEGAIELPTDEKTLYDSFNNALSEYSDAYFKLVNSLSPGTKEEQASSQDEDYIKLKVAEINLYYNFYCDDIDKRLPNIEIKSYRSGYKSETRPLSIEEIKNLKTGEHVEVFIGLYRAAKFEITNGKLKADIYNFPLWRSHRENWTLEKRDEYLQKLYNLEKAYYDKKESCKTKSSVKTQEDKPKTSILGKVTKIMKGITSRNK